MFKVGGKSKVRLRGRGADAEAQTNPEDPQHRRPGTSVHPPSRISLRGNRHLRLALDMPALVASRVDPPIKAFYEQLKERHKASLQALVALQRKMLHAIYGSFKSNTPYNGAKTLPPTHPNFIGSRLLIPPQIHLQTKRIFQSEYVPIYVKHPTSAVSQKFAAKYPFNFARLF
jgi:hypothetical protein